MGKCLFTCSIIYRYFLICSVILSLKLLESKKEGTTANIDEREILLGTVAGIWAKARKFKAVLLSPLLSIYSVWKQSQPLLQLNMHFLKTNYPVEIGGMVLLRLSGIQKACYHIWKLANH